MWPKLCDGATGSDTMHVQLVFKWKEELDASLVQVLNFTSQLTACSPQGSQPTEEDDAICNSKELKYSSPRWQLAGCKITSAGRTM